MSSKLIFEIAIALLKILAFKKDNNISNDTVRMVRDEFR